MGYLVNIVLLWVNMETTCRIKNILNLFRHKERCVLCDKTVNIFQDTPIDDRRFYIEGCGQLYESCFKRNIINDTWKFIKSIPTENVFKRITKEKCK